MLPIAPSYLLYYLPLIIAIALVFGGTRHENTKLILQHAWQTGRWITGFMAVIFIVICIFAFITLGMALYGAITGTAGE